MGAFCVLAVFSLLNVWPFFWFHYLPFMDHPSHLLQASILANFHSSDLQYERFFAINTLPVPNLLNDYFTAALAQLFSIDVASRMAIGFGVVTLPLSVWFYLSQTRPGTEPWAFFAVPMSWSRFLFFGNENFCLAVPLLFVLLGLLGSWDSRYSLRKIAAFTLLATLIYFSHFLVFAVAGLAFTLHFALGKWNVRNALLHFGPLTPGCLFAALWFSQKANGGMPVWRFNLLEKLQALSEALCPAPWGAAVQSVAWQCLCLSIVIFLFVSAFRLFSDPAKRLPILLVLCCSAIAFVLQRWTIIFIPDQRMWWMTLLMGFALFPVFSPKSLIPLGIFALPLAIGTSISTQPLFAMQNQQLAMVDNAFANFPKGLRLLYFGDPNLPAHLHRAFEYYHIRKGGRTTMQFVGKDHSVVYKEGGFLTPPGTEFEIYSYNATAWVPYINEFDGALIIGDPSKASNEIVSTLTNKGFRAVSSGAITLLLSPNYRTDSLLFQK